MRHSSFRKSDASRRLPSICCRGGPAFSTQTIGLFVFTQAFYGASRNPGFAASIAMVQFALVFAIALIMQSYLRRREEVL